MEPWYKVATPRKEVREGRSFNPDEFAIHLEQVVAKTAPEDYREPSHFFSRTCFTRALREHIGMILRRLNGETANTAPVMTLITQFGGGKTHTLTALYHLVTSSAQAAEFSGVAPLLREAGIASLPAAKVAVFVGNAWDPQEGRETPWIDVARQLAGEKGVNELGSAARSTPPGTEALIRVFGAAGAPVLLLFDEVLNFLNRHRAMADHFHAFLQNLTVATTGTTHGAAVISLPRSQVAMTDWDMQWQDRITKVVRRVAKDLIANDETEISEVIRRRLFEDVGNEKIGKAIARDYAEWCFERRAQLPSEWTAVDTSRHAGRWRCLHSGFHGLIKEDIGRHRIGSLSLPLVQLPWTSLNSGASSSANSGNPDLWRLLMRTSPGCIPTPAPSMPMQRAPLGISTDASAQPFFSNPPAGRWTRWPICRNSGLPCASLTSIRPLWIMPHSPLKINRTSSDVLARTASRSAISRR